ncbi:MAG TPA: hypothetical protein VGM08_02225 [Candidatus Saccharimonadales bacterium]|jgi:hypothetical protein
MKLRHDWSGFSVLEILLAVVIVAVLGLTGYSVYHQRQHTARYVDFGQPGISIKSTTDAVKLTGAGNALQKYFAENAGKPVPVGGSDAKTTPQVFYVRSAYGNYAVGGGNGYGAEVIWGPRNNGSIDVLVAAQEQWNCAKLSVAHVPVRLLPNTQCYDSNDNLVAYKG